MTISVKVKPRARRRSLEEIGPAEFQARLLSPPTRGRANKELIEIIAAAFNLPKSGIRIIKGEKSRQKVVCLEVEGKKALRLRNENYSDED